MEVNEMNVQDLINKRANAWEAAKAFLDSHRNENGILSDADGETYDRMEKEITDLTREIERLNRQKAIEEQMGKPTASPLTGRPGAAAPSDDPDEKHGRASKAYAKAMIAAMRTGFHQISNVLEEGNDANGGYLVPEEWDSRLIDKLTEENIFRSLATTITTSGEHKINIAATKPAAAWIEEGEALSFGEATFDQVVLDAHKLHVAIKITEELLYDNAFDLENYVIGEFGKALGNAEEDAFLNGDGKGKPLGIFAETGGGEAGVTISGTKLSSDDILTLIYSLKRPYRKNASFILNDQTLAVIRKLKDNNGSYIWQPSYTAGEPDKLCGYDIHTSAYAPLLEAGKPAIAFGDYSYYNIGDRGTRSFQELRELFAGNGMVGYVAKERVDGKLVLPEAIQILKAGASA
jgi:HK97 family phage major capsid protein